MRPSLLAAVACVILPLTVYAANNEWGYDYTLLDPVPSDQLRPLSSEAYDGVMDARTLDAGHYQVEGEFINYFYNSSTPFSYDRDEYSWEPRITVGLLNNLDFYVRPSFEIRERYDHSSFSEFGHIATGVKLNLLGDDSGMFAVAVKPYVSIPTSRGNGFGGGGVLGGGDVALLVRLPWELSVKVDSEVYATENNADAHFIGFYNAASINKTICSKVDAYAYADSTVTTDPNQTWYGFAGLGLKYSFTSDLQVFAGFGFGWTAPNWVPGEGRAYDYNPRAGFVWRF
jgi:outer membrane putative beta-barrel porin/alpha-amylase